jgi:DnaJ-class molecular chaperone
MAGRLIQTILKRLVQLETPEDGADIRDTIRLSQAHAASGGPYAYYHRQHDKKLIVQIPANVQNDQHIRLQGQGQPGRSGGKRGDLFLKIRIRKPLLDRLKALFKAG